MAACRAAENPAPLRHSHEVVASDHPFAKQVVACSQPIREGHGSGDIEPCPRGRGDERGGGIDIGDLDVGGHQLPAKDAGRRPTAGAAAALHQHSSFWQARNDRDVMYRRSAETRNHCSLVPKRLCCSEEGVVAPPLREGIGKAEALRVLLGANVDAT